MSRVLAAIIQPTLTKEVCEKMAPQLVLIDDQSNGWRCFTLPVAHVDELVMHALISASAFGFNDQLQRAHVFYEKVLHGLRQRQNFERQGRFAKQCVVLSLLLLLAGVMVHGSPDFRGILRSMEAFLRAADDGSMLTEDELGRFLLRQVQKYARLPTCNSNMNQRLISQDFADTPHHL